MLYGNSVLTTYKSLDFSLPKLPPRSSLNQLQPNALGTPLVESLTGYVARLAESHCVPTGILILSKIAPLVKEGYVFAGREGGINPIFGSGTRALNGTGAMAANLVQAIEALTLCSDLRFLTMLPWAEVLPARDLPKTVHAWCPICYEEWRSSGRMIYEPLLWSLAVVTICPTYVKPLCTQCPHCQKQLPCWHGVRDLGTARNALGSSVKSRNLCLIVKFWGKIKSNGRYMW